ncbi:iron-sulfur cluster assembly protein [Paenibacillus sp. UNCCL117]|uniref:HesB/IscA family protein n=1 Tax=unclassified Paenibacillus TaxID=185978 RepID=UPI00087F00B1|nr:MULTISPECIES: iron-sulfur cluster assembly accessory protein [unclassified Paenibacillus]SDE03784.1 iron-sulfur cluster assembly protein [Paenibacillus sp. cl123]SFW57485.1 iron-sulfur cluster assembly protein [Paenibacillus sp. UNCCL117]
MITISETASDKIKQMLQAEEAENLFLRIGVKSGGCSGFSYGMGFDDNEQEGDKVMEIHGLKVVVDEESSKYLYGVEIDFQDTGIGGGFTIQNPNAVASCGCGQSFRTKEEDAVLAQPCED